MIAGRCWVFGDNINTDALAPGQYIKAPIETLAEHCLESVNPEFASKVRPGDLIVAGRNFGMGSSREQAAQALVILGVKGVVAQSFGGIFYRNALNLGLPACTPQVTGITSALAHNGDQVTLNLVTAELHNLTSGTATSLKPLPDFLAHLVAAGGLIKVLEERFKPSTES